VSADACRAALDAAFAADRAVCAALGDPPRIFDAPVRHSAFPFAVWRRWETKPAHASLVPTEEHLATLEVVSRQTGAEEARAAVHALRDRANGPRPVCTGARIVLVLPVYSDVFRGVDGRTWLGVVRLRIIAETSPPMIEPPMIEPPSIQQGA
jgi:Protein of unknown function (DUF3168)